MPDVIYVAAAQKRDWIAILAPLVGGIVASVPASVIAILALRAAQRSATEAQRSADITQQAFLAEHGTHLEVDLDDEGRRLTVINRGRPVVIDHHGYDISLYRVQDGQRTLVRKWPESDNKMAWDPPHVREINRHEHRRFTVTDTFMRQTLDANADFAGETLHLAAYVTLVTGQTFNGGSVIRLPTGQPDR